MMRRLTRAAAESVVLFLLTLAIMAAILLAGASPVKGWSSIHMLGCPVVQYQPTFGHCHKR